MHRPEPRRAFRGIEGQNAEDLPRAAPELAQIGGDPAGRAHGFAADGLAARFAQRVLVVSLDGERQPHEAHDPLRQ